MEKNKINIREFFHKRIVIDTSVLLKSFFTEEEGSAFVDELFDMHMRKELTLMATPLVVFEFMNVLSKSSNDFEFVKNAFIKFRKLGLALIELDDYYAISAAKNACDNKNVSYYDASYYALAKDMDAVFLTADRKFYEQMKGATNIQLF